MQLSPNFSLAELTASQTAARRGIDNTPSSAVIDNLIQLCNNVLQPIRARFGRPVRISSGYRSVALNRRIGGSRTSQHCTGNAADITVDGVSVEELYNYIKTSYLPYDQVINEFGAWVHVSYDPARNRRQCLIAERIGRKTVYRNG